MAKQAKPSATGAKAAATATVVASGNAVAALQRAVAATEPGDRLVEVLAAWAVYPSHLLVVMVTRVAAIAAREREAISGLDVAERHAAWLAVEAGHDAADVDRLLATLVEGRCAQAIERMTRMAARPRDPRFVAQLAAYITADPTQHRGETSPVPFTSDANRKFWVQLLALVEDRGDASLVAPFAAVAAREPGSNFARWLATKLTQLAPILAARAPRPLAPAEAAALAALDASVARIEAAFKPVVDTSAALFDAVWAAPDDDAPRLVLADFLTERGDPRGEFIMLQLAHAAGALDAAGKKREKELLKRHKKLWLGPIGVLMQPHALRFERGFLVTCFLEPNAALEATLGNHPAWSTIREYYIHGYARETARPLAAMLDKHGASQSTTRFTRGLE
ncbi:MAG: TIGR02996 domain-containing protein [Proteobacteria bacterium]|nr:TIGR02996 domain-containing protein [Pseudomonadota bacterium]